MGVVFARHRQMVQVQYALHKQIDTRWRPPVAMLSPAPYVQPRSRSAYSELSVPIFRRVEPPLKATSISLILASALFLVACDALRPDQARSSRFTLTCSSLETRE